MTLVTRFAPSPTGYLHLGHAYSALFAWRAARAAGGRFLLRIDDMDLARVRREFEQAIYDDLRWLGLDWDPPLRRQSDSLADYRSALERLAALDVLYPCFCTRKTIRAEIAAAGNAPHGSAHGPAHGPTGPLYPGTCRRMSREQRQAALEEGKDHAIRLDVAKASTLAGPLTWLDLEQGELDADPTRLGDVVLSRKETAGSYHLAVVLDDAAQGVTLVSRGADLFEASHLHRLLQALLGLPVPRWHHHRLITDQEGRRLAKRHDALSLRALRAAGRTPEEVRALAEES